MKIETPYPEPTDAVTFIEKQYPETARAFKAIQHDQYTLFCRKQMDYGPSNIAMGTNLETEEDVKLSLTALVVRMNDKIQRLINLILRQNVNAQNEPAMDSIKDLSIYGIIAQVVEDGSWGK